MGHIIEIARDFTFEAAHCLPMVAHGHKCSRMHGHSYRVTVVINGPIGDDGMVIDTNLIKGLAGHHIDLLDHQTLNDYLPNPTAENLAVWLWNHIARDLPQLTAITVRETASTSFTYRGKLTNQEAS